MKARHALEYAGARILLAFFRLLPLRLGCAVGAWLGSVVCALDRRHRNLGLWNLSRSTADRGPRGNRRVVRGLYRHLGMMLAETANQSRLDVGAIGRMIVVEGDEHLRRALARGKGAIIVVAHFGNWELSGAACALAGHRVKVVAFPQRNR